MRFENKNKKEHIEMGEYVLTRTRNAFNNKTSYWLSNPKDIKQEADKVELKLFKDRATGREFTYFSDNGVFYVFENDRLFYKGTSDNIQQTIEEKRGEVEFIALTKEQEYTFSPKATDFHGHYVFSDVKGLEGIWYRTDIVRSDGTRVYTKFQ